MTDMHFLPYFRTGLASNINETAVDGLTSGAQATATMSVSVTADRADGGADTRAIRPRDVRLFGPGAITGIDAGQIIRRYPEPGATDPELNYFCLAEFRDPDFPWRYTPAAPDRNNRLQPWLSLVVVPTDDCTVTSGPALDQLEVAGDLLPAAADVWAWAHVQVDSSAPEIDPIAEYASRPHAFRSRLMSPTRLLPDTSYVACIVPTFEAGRLAGLGSPNVDATGPAWSDAAADVTLPIYATWSFRTTEPGDFESLVRRLTARELPAEVGVRDLDISHPGSGVPDVPGSVVSFFGALTSPAAAPQQWTDDQRVPVQNGLLRVLRDDVPFADDADPDDYDPLVHDPVVRPSLYGSMQSGETALAPGPVVGSSRVRGGGVPGERVVPGTGRPRPVGDVDRLVRAADNPRVPPVRWLDDLNLDPQTRTVGGIGSAVVRQDQERLMDAAWEAARGINDVNRLLNAAVTAKTASVKLEQRVVRLPAERLLQLVGPSLSRHRAGRGTRLRQLRQSDLPNMAAAGAFRRMVRPGGMIGRRLDLADAGAAVITRLRQVPNGPIAGHRRPATPAGCGLLTDLTPPTPDARPSHLQLLDPNIAKFIDSKNLGERNTPLRLKVPNENVHRTRLATPPGVGGRIVGPKNDPDRLVRVLDQPLRTRGRLPKSNGELATKDLIQALPRLVETRKPINNRLRATITAPDGIPTDEYPPKMWATPNFPQPVYERVKALGVEYLVPGVGLIPDETVGLLETNDRYVESVMVGANHELSREFLWREYPAQLHRTWFRQFWNAPRVDIAPIADWRSAAPLGSQDGSAVADLVLVIKGVFPRRYPDVQVWAQEGEWALDETNDRWERNIKQGGNRRYPVMAGELQPGVVFYGFELDELEAVGGSLDPEVREAAGWFFVLQEQPRGVRFGLDRHVESSNQVIEGLGTAPSTWADLTWGHVGAVGSTTPPLSVDLGATPWLHGVSRSSDPSGSGAKDIWADDAAAQARITLQRPVQLKVHASAMLPDRKAN